MDCKTSCVSQVDVEHKDWIAWKDSRITTMLRGDESPANTGSVAVGTRTECDLKRRNSPNPCMAATKYSYSLAHSNARKTVFRFLGFLVCFTRFHHRLGVLRSPKLSIRHTPNTTVDHSEKHFHYRAPAHVPHKYGPFRIIPIIGSLLISHKTGPVSLHLSHFYFQCIPIPLSFFTIWLPCFLFTTSHPLLSFYTTR